MTDRLNTIFLSLSPCEVFADVGCDHGYIAKAMLDSGKCQKAIISDISERCLEKAKTLLSEYIDSKKCYAVVSNGFSKTGKCDLALIAGMGGEEIVSILLNAPSLPYKLVLQPMKNPEKVRETAVSLGYKILSDRVFIAENKYYDLIVLEKGKDNLSNEEKEFGRTNLEEKGEAFIKRISDRINLLSRLIEDKKVSEEEKEKLFSELEKLKKYV